MVGRLLNQDQLLKALHDPKRCCLFNNSPDYPALVIHQIRALFDCSAVKVFI